MKKIRQTKQKWLLEKKLKGQNKLFTAEDLFDEVKKENKKIGIATIYRFLKDNSKKYNIHSYDCNRRKIYSIKTNNHCHFKCEKCKKIEHFNIEELGFLKNKLKGDICHFQIDISGVCEKCKNELSK
jgi:Fe2+ or Zn2+ uptake regulation protein